MSIFGTIGTVLGGAAGGAIGGPFGAQIGAGLGAGLGNAIGGGSSGGSGSSGTYQLSPNQYAQIAAQMGAAQNPLTLAGTRYGQLSGVNTAGLGRLGNLYATSSAQALADAVRRGNLATDLQASEVAGMLTRGLDLYKDLGSRRLDIATMPAAFIGQGASQALTGENTLAMGIGGANIDLKKAKELAKIDIAKDQNYTVNDMGLFRAQTEGNLALGSQRIGGDIQKIEASTLGNLARGKQAIQGDLSKIRANVEGQKERMRYGNELAMAGQRAFA